MRHEASSNTFFSGGGDQQLWVGLPVKSLLTPYTEIRELLSRLGIHDQSTVVDLGAGYGRMAFVMAAHYPRASFVGYEYVSERVIECNRCLQTYAKESFESRKVQMLTADLSNPAFLPIEAEFYFLYDYGSREAIRKTLDDLKKIAGHRGITVVGRGRASRDAIERENPWLSQVVPAEHYPHYSIYRTSFAD